MADWGSVKREHIIAAIKRFDREQPKVPPSRNTFLKFNDKQYPAKHIRGMAYEIANKVEISKEDYHGGIETVKFFDNFGFDVIYNGELKASFDSVSNVAKGNDLQTNKIKITSKHVVDQKNAFKAVLNKVFNGDVICEKGYPWMKTPGADKDKIYKKLIKDIHNYRGDSKFAKENYKLKCDFVCDSKRVIFEYDERQHFSMARKIALESYVDTVDMYYDAQLWIKACGDINAKDNSPVNRDEVRAFYDSVRDIEAAKNGYYLIRIMHGGFDWSREEAVDYLKVILKDNNIIL